MTVTDSFGCAKKASPFTVETIDFSAYPKPVTDFINFEIETTEPRDLTVQVINSAGKVIQTREIKAYEGILRGRVNMINRASGLYILRVVTPSKAKSLKFQKVKGQ